MVDQATEAVFAATAAQMARDYVDQLGATLSRNLKNHVLPHFQDFRDYMSVTYRRCNSIKIIIDRDQVHRLDDIYVKGKCTNGTKIYDDDDIADMVRQSGRVVVQGFGGIGKTVLLKYIWLSIFRSPEGKIPVFIELRRLNDLKSTDVPAFIRASLSPSGTPLSEEQFGALLKAGRFVFLFDALDEVNDEIRGDVEKHILNLSEKYPECGFLVSSRHDSRFQSWELFSVFNSESFSKDQIEEVIKKVPFENKTRTKFLTEIIEKKYDKYSEFLSTPLMAIMMLMTYDQFADIPDKIHIFYRYAFQTLYTLHDAGKESFRRRRKSSLSEDDFTKVFSIFCLASYMEHSFNFNKAEILLDIKKAADRANIVVDAEDFLAEVCESVNLMFEEGDILNFTHRSFQEYFAAFALTTHFSNNFGKLAARIPNAKSDSVFSMTYEMNKDLVEDAYLVPNYKNLKSVLTSVYSKESSAKELAEIFGIRFYIFCGTGSRSKVVHEYFAVSEFSDFLRRATSFLPELRQVEFPDGQVVQLYPADFRLLARRITTAAGWTKKQLPPFFNVLLDEARLVVNHRDFEKLDFQSEAVGVAAFEELESTKKVLWDAFGEYRLISTFVDKAMQQVSRRSKEREATLDELLD